MNKLLYQNIDLDRNFIKLNEEDAESNNFRASIWNKEETLWADLLEKPRVIILAEAGAGKTHELRFQTKTLRASGKHAFFIRIEHLSDEFEFAFDGNEFGSIEDFETWKLTEEKAWFFLDSVDEAKLVNPKDFEIGLKKLHKYLESKLQDIHIVITSRPTFEPKSELAIIKRFLPYSSLKIEDEVENSLEQEPSNTFFDQNVKTEKTKEEEEIPAIYSLAPLSEMMVKTFATAKGVSDVNEFLNALMRSGADNYATRPRDLEGLIFKWQKDHLVGSKKDIIEADIDRRIIEEDGNRALKSNLTETKIREGIIEIAAVTTLCEFSRIAVPSKTAPNDSISITKILVDWTAEECEALLQLPLFDDCAYGTVRIHNRETREYLAALWFEKLIEKGGRIQVEAMFFHNQYGIELSRPKLRHVLPWLAIADDNILKKAIKTSAADLLLGGDPVKFPLEIRVLILEQTCANLAEHEYRRNSFDISVVEKFATEDISEKVEELLDKYRDFTEVRTLLLRMVWQGQLRTCANLVMEFSSNTDYESYTRECSIRSCEAICTEAQIKQMIDSTLLNITAQDRDVFEELIDCFAPKYFSVSTMLPILNHFESLREFEVDSLKEALKNLVNRVNEDDLKLFLNGAHNYLKLAPHIEEKDYKFSVIYQWLVEPVATALGLLAEMNSHIILDPKILELVSQIGSYGYRHYNEEEYNSKLKKKTARWKKFNNALFWHDVAQARLKRNKEITHFRYISHNKPIWSVENITFEETIGWINNKNFLEDKQVALSLVIGIYRDNKKPKEQRQLLWETVKGNSVLEIELREYMQSDPKNNYKSQNKRWERNTTKRQKKWEEKDNKLLAENIKYANDNLDKITYFSAKDGDGNYDIQYGLMDHMRGKRGLVLKRACSNWEFLIKDFGSSVANAFREFLINSWRYHTPKFNSEIATNTFEYVDLFGLSGLEILDQEDPAWFSKLSENEAKIVARYAFKELNKFPKWFEIIYTKFPIDISKFLVKEINWEVFNYIDKEQPHQILHDVVHHCRFAWEELTYPIFEAINKTEPEHISSLNHCLTILFASNQFDKKLISVLAKKRIRIETNFLTLWYAVWIAADPEEGISGLEKHLPSLNGQEKATIFAMEVMVALNGGVFGNHVNLGNGFKSPKYLASLYVLMNKYIHMSDDINRAGTGIYSPKLRDEAQEARSSLLTAITKIAGKDAFLALKYLSEEHPFEEAKEWMKLQMIIHAEKEADLPVMSIKAVRQISDRFEKTPKSAKDLFHIAQIRLGLLKKVLEDGEDSPAFTWKREDQEVKLRILIANWLRDRSNSMYSVHQEEEQADGKKPDIRFYGLGFDTPVPVELKIAGNWSGMKLFERLENQLCNDYLRDCRTGYGIYLIVNRHINKKWQHPITKKMMSFTELVSALSKHATSYISDRVDIDDIDVVGIDLTERGIEKR